MTAERAANGCDMDEYARQCVAMYHYLNQGETWVPQRPRRPLPVADMDPAWRHNAANWLERRAQALAFRYRFGVVKALSAPSMREVIGESNGKPVYGHRTFSHLDLMGEHAQDGFDAALNEVTADPVAWLRDTPLYRALVAGLPTGGLRDKLAARAKHWAGCPQRKDGRRTCRCTRLAAEHQHDREATLGAPEWTAS